MDEVIAQFEKNATEVIRLSLTAYHGRQLIDARVYYSDDEGQYRPTRKGLSLAVSLYADFKRALLRLEKELIDRKLLTQEELDEAVVADVEED
jgi:hypothetical protein